MIEFFSNKVPRIARSSLADEGSARATAADRMLLGKLESGSK